jgi:hypothetical protein
LLQTIHSFLSDPGWAGIGALLTLLAFILAVLSMLQQQEAAREYSPTKRKNLH